MIKSKDDFSKWIEETKEGVETCKCERCGKEFQIKKAYGKRSKSSKGYYRLKKSSKILCPGCFSSDSFKKTFSQKSELQKKIEQNKRVKAKQNSIKTKQIEDSNRIYNDFNLLKEDYKKTGLQAANVVCEACGKILYLKDRQAVYRFVRYHDRILCKGCGISKSQALSHAKKRKEKLYEEREVEHLSSKEESELVSYIKSIYKGKIILNDRDLIGFEIDIYLPEIKLAFEYDGSYWHSYKSKYYHLDKTILCERRGIKLIHVYDSVWKSENEFIKKIIAGSINGERLKPSSNIIILDRRYYSIFDKPQEYFIAYKTEPTVYYSNCRVIKKDYSVNTPYNLFDCGNLILMRGNGLDYESEREHYLNFVDLEVKENEKFYWDYYKAKFDNYLSLGTTDISKIKEIINNEMKRPLK